MYTIATLEDLRRHLNLSATDTQKTATCCSDCRPPASSSSR